MGSSHIVEECSALEEPPESYEVVIVLSLGVPSLMVETSL